MNDFAINWPRLDTVRKHALRVGVVFAILAVILAVMNPEQFFRSYLFAYIFWFGIAIGCMVIIMLNHMTGGAWGAIVRRILEAGTRTIPIMAILFLPIALGVFHLYHWSSAEEVAKNEVLQHKQVYLNVPFFLIRAALYFAIWIFMTLHLNRLSALQDETADPAVSRKLQILSGPGLIVYGLTMTFASVDWMMSLEPHWFSTMYGLLVMAGQTLSAFAFVIAVAAVMIRTTKLGSYMTANHFHDLGKLLLAFVMIWAYLSFSQFIIIWSGNLPEEIPWYIHRLGHGWQYIALFLVVMHFALPFLLLLSRSNKKDPKILSYVAIGVLFMRTVDLFWLIAPEFAHEGFRMHILDVVLPVGIGALWLSAFLWQLKKRPVIPFNDPDLKEALQHA